MLTVIVFFVRPSVQKPFYHLRVSDILTGSDVISIFDRSAPSILTRCRALVVFCRLVFLEFLRWSVCQSKLSFKFIIK